ncbi:MAG: hypothetical protein GY906_27835 [bacterium]|nr:hypothetical protein [bacterium]
MKWEVEHKQFFNPVRVSFDIATQDELDAVKNLVQAWKGYYTYPTPDTEIALHSLIAAFEAAIPESS